ncbi:MAG TPA: phosphatidylglycerophosphatase A [Candidatus Polarisedimenticolia bacterium]|nr:phosphatidylglycerophosphatase A [Candidatus Polarisedimenticolia bacterium]
MKESAPSPSSAATVPPPRKPRFALFVATACGLGYIPLAPGTFGSLAGLLAAMLPWWTLFALGAVSRDTAVVSMSFFGRSEFDPFVGFQIWLLAIVAALGVWAASRSSDYWKQKDPQRVVIDEVSGQHLAIALGCGVPVSWKPDIPLTGFPFGQASVHSVLSWKYLLLGLILFRVFDIWKPFPVRQAERLPGGWGIMADDWIAAVYAALGLWIARTIGL